MIVRSMRTITRLDSPTLILTVRTLLYLAILIAVSVVSFVTSRVEVHFVYQGF
jgi:hypothetical protein